MSYRQVPTAPSILHLAGSGGRARTSNIRLQRPTFCRLNYPGSLPGPAFANPCELEVRHPTSTRRAKSRQ